MRAFLITAAAALGAVRVLGLFGLFDGLHPVWLQVFKDTAHLFVGAVIGAAVVYRTYLVSPHGGSLGERSSPYTLLVRLAVGLSVLETVCAVLQRVVFHG